MKKRSDVLELGVFGLIVAGGLPLVIIVSSLIAG